MKIGILTFHSANNYGAKLQAFALMKYLQTIGHDTELINYRPVYFDKMYTWFDKDMFESHNPFIIVYRLLKWCITGYYRFKRYKSFEQFENKFFTLSPVIKNDEPDYYEAYIVGSDQVWSRKITKGDKYYTCGFSFNKGKKKYISYAPSFESIEMTEDSKAYFKELLSRFDYLSVRENKLLDYLSPLTEKKIYQVLDPTLLLDQKVWDSIIGDRIIKGHYIAYYQVRGSKQAISSAKKFAKDRGCKFIRLIAFIRIGNDNRYSTYSPAEFVNIIKYADAVITTSFHGTAFSLIYEKEFYALSLGDGKDTRVRSLLETVGMTDRIVPGNSSIPSIPIDYTQAREKLKVEKKKSFDFISNCLS